MKELFTSTSDWDSHLPLLYCVLENGNKACGITEIGCGLLSTPALAEYANKKGRYFSFYETNTEWYKKVCDSLSNLELHAEGILLKDYSDFYCPETILFVDCAPAEKRKEIIERFKNDSDIIIVHDSEEVSDYVYGLKNILSTFKYRLDYKPERKPHTTAVSNSIDVSKWEI